MCPRGVKHGFPEASGGLLVARSRVGGSKGESEIGKKKKTVGPGGARRRFSDRFQPSGGARGSILDPFWLPLGWFLGFCLAVFLEIAKMLFFANTLSEHLVFEAPWGFILGAFSEPK